ncbi:MAG: SH3 domain-containing protein [Desulfovibrio sp.]|nr:MAG: SH3 domain-containing protein [Desulfovibrio sp.]
MAFRLASLLFAFCCVLPATVLAQGYCNTPMFAPGESHMVVDDGNNLRQWGGANYASAPILGVLNTGDEVRVLSVADSWAEVVTRDGVHGFMSARYIMPTENFLAPGGPADRLGMVNTCQQRSHYINADLDGDGRPERLQLTCEPSLYCSNQHLDVFSSDGRLLFQGPRYGNSPLIFCACEFGIYEPNVIADLDGDRMAELLVMQPKSDVSPGLFDMHRWNGNGFTPLWQNMGFIAEPGDPDYLRMVPNAPVYPLPFRFAVDISMTPGGEVQVSILDSQWNQGLAIVRFDGRGFRVTRWVIPMGQGQ